MNPTDVKNLTQHLASAKSIGLAAATSGRPRPWTGAALMGQEEQSNLSWLAEPMTGGGPEWETGGSACLAWPWEPF